MGTTSKKICIIADHFFQGGFTTSMLAMAKELKKHGVNVHILLLNSKHNAYDISCLAGIEYSDIPVKCKEAFSLPRLYMQMKDRLLIHHLDHRRYHSADKNKEKRAQVKRVQLALEYHVLHDLPQIDLTSYDCVVSWEELTCNDFLAYNVNAKKKIGYIHPDYQISGFDRKIDYPVLRKLDTIVGVSRATVATMKQIFPELADRICYVPNITDRDEIVRKAELPEKTFEKSSFDIVTVCRLSIFHKGLDRLVHVAKRLNEDGFVFQWYLIGEGEEEKVLEKMIQADNLNNLHLIGGRDNPFPFMKKADLFVLLSNYEGRPMVVDEAEALGIPVLVTDYASAREQVDESSGYIVAMDDEAAYLQLREILLNKGSLNRVKNGSKQEFSYLRHNQEGVSRLMQLI